MIEEWIGLNKTMKTNYFKAKLRKGLCKSLKVERNEDFIDFMELFKNHPDYQTKLKDVIDLTIVFNKRNHNFFEINLVKSNGDIEDISYRYCINERCENYNLNSALRYTIEPQILEFRKTNILICEFCNSKENIHIDHIILFKILANNFLKTKKYIPIDFDDNEYNGCKFKKEDEDFKNEWFDYHKHNAKLRCLCSKCNSQRAKN